MFVTQPGVFCVAGEVWLTRDLICQCLKGEDLQYNCCFACKGTLQVSKWRLVNSKIFYNTSLLLNVSQCSKRTSLTST